MDRAAVPSVEAGHPHVRAEQQVILLFAQVEESSTVQAARDDRTAHRDLHPSPAAPAVAGVTVDMLSHLRGPRTMTLVGFREEKKKMKEKIDCQNQEKSLNQHFFYLKLQI